MIPHPPQLDAIGTETWEPLLRATVVDPGGRSSVTSTPVMPSGEYVSDASVWPRQTATLTLPTALTPDRTAPPVSPYGGALLLDVGARIRGQEYWMRLATLDVVETTVDRPDGTINVRAASHEARVDEDNYETRASSPAGTGTALVIGLVRRTMGSTWPVLNRVTSDPTYAAGAFKYDGSTWTIVEQIASTSGFEAHFDAAGTLVLAPSAIKAGVPLLTYRGGPGGTLLGYTSGRGWAYNRVAVVYDDGTSALGAAHQLSVRSVGIWEDTNPASATRVNGPYGRHTKRVDVPVDPGKVPTVAVANRAAATIARRAAAPYRSVDLRTIPAPWIEPGDTIGVTYEGTTAVERLIVGRHAFPLDQLSAASVTVLDDAYTQGI